MKRRNFIGAIAAGSAFMTLSELKSFSESFKESENSMPVLFMGHGSPMNGIEDNEFSRNWQRIGREIAKPAAVLCISAHWLTKGTLVTAMEKPRTIHDFGGFPQALFDVQYPAPGSPQIAAQTKGLIKSTSVGIDHEWGLDHGTWSVVKHMYPNADIPVLQLSIDYSKGPSYHFELAKELKDLRKRGVLIVGSGNMVHNLGMVAWQHLDKPEYGYDWAIEMNETFKKKITSRQFSDLLNYEALGQEAKLAIPTPDHYYPLLYSLGLVEATDAISFFNDRVVGGSITMTSVRIG